MKKKLISAGLAGIVLAGAVTFATRGKSSGNTENLGIPIDERVFISKDVEKLVNWTIEEIPGKKYMKIAYPFESPRVRYINGDDFPFGKGESRITQYMDLRNLSKELGRIPSSGFFVVEEKIGEDIWEFRKINYSCEKGTEEMIAEVKERIPWIIEAAERREPYILTAERNREGKVRKLTYHLQRHKRRFIRR